ncbi:hypothetical protein llap_15099 [Limosa lapponica baueri]|uniref:Uncharacterized protein n=1 Tax=Limosa lapponica baueri TaxID=1758121 RepID=A0A2I0TLC7_LIMLA|nr:hypothetical protein llap_15099 [Limosa lapponica baueri]
MAAVEMGLTGLAPTLLLERLPDTVHQLMLRDTMLYKSSHHNEKDQQQFHPVPSTNWNPEQIAQTGQQLGMALGGFLWKQYLSNAHGPPV